MTSKIIERIERQVGVPGLMDALAERLSLTDLQSLLLEVFRRRSAQQNPAAVLAAYEANRFVRPSQVSPVQLLAWEQVAFSQLPSEFQPIALSPVTPLATCSAIAAVDQHRVLSTIRNTEVVSDSTNTLALEAAFQRRQHLRANPKSPQAVHLAASHRLLRTQHYQNNPHALAHFSAFALCSAGRDQGNLRFECSVLVLHIGFYLRALYAFLGAEVPLHVSVADFDAADRQAWLAEQLFIPLRALFPQAEYRFDQQRTSGEGYYDDLCFHVHAASPSGQLLELADGGVVNWTQKLLNNAKERCVISGIGSERVCTAWA